MPRLLLSFALVLASLGFASAQMAPLPKPAPGQAVATFAGGCFWCTESDFDHVPGVISTTSGYTGGHVANPNYEQVSGGGTGHAELVQVIYDPKKVSYQQLLTYFWHHVDPTVKDRQFCDYGHQYRTAIFVHNDEEKKLAEELEKAGRGRAEDADLYRDRHGRAVLSGRGVSPGFLCEEPGEIQILPLELRARSAPQAALGRAQRRQLT